MKLILCSLNLTKVKEETKENDTFDFLKVKSYPFILPWMFKIVYFKLKL